MRRRAEHFFGASRQLRVLNMSASTFGVPEGTPVRTVPSTGGFSSGLCDCCSDCCSCWASGLCGLTVVAQLVQRTIYTKKGTCLALAVLLWTGVVFQIVFSEPTTEWTAYVEAEDADQFDLVKEQSGGIGSILAAIGGLIGFATCILLCLVRRFVRQRDSIPDACCTGFDDCILSCCCSCCVIAQLMRHEGLVGGRYKLTSPEGTMHEML